MCAPRRVKLWACMINWKRTDETIRFDTLCQKAGYSTSGIKGGDIIIQIDILMPTKDFNDSFRNDCLEEKPAGSGIILSRCRTCLHGAG